MEDLGILILKELMRRRMPDLSHIKPPTDSATQTMIKNLRATAGTKADKSPEQIEYWRELLKGVFN